MPFATSNLVVNLTSNAFLLPGSVPACRLATALPGRFGGLVLLSPLADVNTVVDSQFEDRVRPLLQQRLPVPPEVQDKIITGAPEFVEKLKRFATPTLFENADALKKAAEGTGNKLPALVLSGKSDELLGRRHFAQIVEACEPHCTEKEEMEGGHNLDGKKVAPKVGKFVGRLLVSTEGPAAKRRRVV